METPLEQRDVRRLPFEGVELDWWTLPWLNVPERDRPFTKKAHLDLDPVGGFWSDWTISIGGDRAQYVVIENIDLKPADAFSQQNSVVTTTFDTTILNRWRQIEQFPFGVPPVTVDADLWIDRMFIVPVGRILNLNVRNTSPLGRVRYDIEIKGWISRMAN